VCEAISLLLLLFTLSSLLALFGEEPALRLEPGPATLNVPRSVLHGHLLLDLSFLHPRISSLLFVTLLALLSVTFNLVHDGLNFLLRLALAVLDLVALVFNAGNLRLAFGLLLLVLQVEVRHTLLQMHLHSTVDLALSAQHSLHAIDLFLEFALLLGVETVLARLLALNLTFQVLNMQVLLDLSLVLLALQLRHLLVVLLLLAREVVLQLLVLGRGLLDILS